MPGVEGGSGVVFLSARGLSHHPALRCWRTHPHLFHFSRLTAPPPLAPLFSPSHVHLHRRPDDRMKEGGARACKRKNCSQVFLGVFLPFSHTPKTPKKTHAPSSLSLSHKPHTQTHTHTKLATGNGSIYPGKKKGRHPSITPAEKENFIPTSLSLSLSPPPPSHAPKYGPIPLTPSPGMPPGMPSAAESTKAAGA